jgi:hypothetical protein
MSRQILINHAGDGEWIMLRVGGIFNPVTDHVIAMHKDGVMQGGVVYTGYLGAAILAHMAGREGTLWTTRDLLWMGFDYPFNQLGVRKILALVPSKNTRALTIDLRMGFMIEAKLTNVFPDDDALVLSMERHQSVCLKWKPRYYRSNATWEMTDGRR